MKQAEIDRGPQEGGKDGQYRVIKDVDRHTKADLAKNDPDGHSYTHMARLEFEGSHFVKSISRRSTDAGNVRDGLCPHLVETWVWLYGFHQEIVRAGLSAVDPEKPLVDSSQSAGDAGLVKAIHAARTRKQALSHIPYVGDRRALERSLDDPQGNVINIGREFGVGVSEGNRQGFRSVGLAIMRSALGAVSDFKENHYKG